MEMALPFSAGPLRVLNIAKPYRNDYHARRLSRNAAGTDSLRYFFDISDGHSVYEDDAGQTFDSPDEARAAASVIAAELPLDSEGQYRGFFVYVTDDDGNDIARIPIPY